jgi:N-methylhydantoinase A
VSKADTAGPPSFRFSCDTGGTFTDLLVEAEDLRLYKAHTVSDDPVRGVLNALRLAADDRGLSLEALLGRGELLAHGTTHAINAIITSRTARTALLVTRGHRDILVLREGGKLDPFDYSIPFPDPYIPRALTYEIPGRIVARGQVRAPLDEPAVLDVIAALKRDNIEAVAVCLLWSIVNPEHELRVGQLLAEHLPGVPVTLSHALNPSLREYRRASSTAIDASLRPMMERYMGGLEARLREAGFGGRILVVTSQGGMMAAGQLAQSPIHAINSGPSMAPVAGRHYGGLDLAGRDVIVADAGGTTYDISLVRGGRIPWTRETWIGEPYSGHMTGFPSVDVKSVGAGGGSIAWVDGGGLLHVGPQSAGATPGPACFGRGGMEPTVTDACVVLGYIDPTYFLGGSMTLDAQAAHAAISRVAEPLGLSVDAAAMSIVQLVTENMVQAIADITTNQGVDPREAVLLGCGGAAGLNSIFIARRLGSRYLLFPEVGAALSAAGALMSDLISEHRKPFLTRTDAFDWAGANAVLEALGEQCRRFEDAAGHALAHARTFSVEARYPGQVWEIEAPLRQARFESEEDLARFVADFHAEHQALFAVADPDSPIEIVSWTGKVASTVRDRPLGRLPEADAHPDRPERPVYFPGQGWTPTRVGRLADFPIDQTYEGPMILETPFTTLVIDPKAQFRLTAAGSVLVTLEDRP